MPVLDERYELLRKQTKAAAEAASAEPRKPQLRELLALAFRSACNILESVLLITDQDRLSGVSRTGDDAAVHKEFLQAVLDLFLVLDERGRKADLVTIEPEAAKIDQMIRMVRILLAGGVVYDSRVEAQARESLDRGAAVSIAEARRRIAERRHSEPK